VAGKFRQLIAGTLGSLERMIIAMKQSLNIIHILVVFGLLGTNCGLADEMDTRTEQIVLGTKYTIHSEILGEDRSFIINLPTSVGHGWAKGPRNAPTVYNAVFNSAQFWDGRAEDLKEQAKGPIQAAVEMNSTQEMVVKTLSSLPAYVSEFKQVFPGEPDPLTFDNITRAIEAFEATLLTPSSRFDQYLEGSEDALTESEKQGLDLFIDKGCADCHGGVNLGGDDHG
jgi:cytochrome c peroxidase